MNVKVYPHTLDIDQDTMVNVGEYNVSTCTFEFSEEYDNLTKMAVFSTCEGSYKSAILGNECTIPPEVLETPGSVLLGVYGYESTTEEGEETLTLRYSPEAEYFIVSRGSYQEAGDPTIPPKSEWEQVVEEVNEAINEANNLNITAEKEDGKTTITITHKDDTEQTVEILDGEKGDKGDKGDAGAVHMIVVQTLPTEDIDESAIYLVPLENPTEEGNNYAEYVYINNQWELLGKIGVHVDLTDYVKFTDIASSSKAGVVKVNNTYGLTISSDTLVGNAKSYANYSAFNDSLVISKGTLENVITGKGLITNTVNNLTNYYTKTEIDNTIGDINSVLDTINGEVI